ncbi:MAG: hypothetical protein JRJ03_05750 [Deltaproteobacteria bacterium]|nr:hypothetical protein [Deltaproteobacteria bacterium]
MKMILKVYEHKETLEKEFSSIEEANTAVEKMMEENPNLHIEPYFEVDAGCVTDESDSQEEECKDLGTLAKAAG